MESLIVHHGANLKGPESVSANVLESTTIERSGAYACSPRRRFLFSRSAENYHSMFIALYVVPSPWRESRVKSPANQRTEKSTFVYEYAINTNPRPCETHYPILWENEKEISAGFQKANTGYIEREIVIVVKVLCCHRLKCSTSLLSDEYLRVFFLGQVFYGYQVVRGAAETKTNAVYRMPGFYLVELKSADPDWRLEVGYAVERTKYETLKSMCRIANVPIPSPHAGCVRGNN
ncbi:hypothetical protein K449DRAFT_434896 [Hypoxylon sp. EC38]|nr:hypothetical protein K449DRAFT_434896 [Hypoxylon sp. EC38]